jgi:hypothetical protein
MRIKNIHGHSTAFAGRVIFRVVGVLVSSVFMLTGSACAYTLVSSNALVFVNVDHAAVGTYRETGVDWECPRLPFRTSAAAEAW